MNPLFFGTLLFRRQLLTCVFRIVTLRIGRAARTKASEMTLEPRPLDIGSRQVSPESQDPTPYTPENTASVTQNYNELHNISSDSSALSSLPSNLGSTPEGLEGHDDLEESERVGATREGSPVRRPRRKRQAPSRYESSSSDKFTPNTAKRRKLLDSPARYLSGSSTIVPSSEISLIKDELHTDFSPSSESSERVTLLSSVDGTSTGEDQSPSARQSHDFVIQESNMRAELMPTKAPSRFPKGPGRQKVQVLQSDIINSFLNRLHGNNIQTSVPQADIDEYFDSLPKAQRDLRELGHEEWKADRMYPGFDRENPIFYQADGYTKTASSSFAADLGSKPGSEAPSPSRKVGKGGSGKRLPFNRGKGKGRGGGAGSGRDRDSPEPPNKTVLSQEDKATLAHIRARQAELKKFFATVASQQRDTLETMASRDLTKLLRKPKAHQKVPEHDEVVQELGEKEQSVRATINTEYEMQVALAQQAMKAEEDIIQAQFQLRVAEAHREHVRGAKGDITIFANAHRAAKDGTWTENGSDVESYFPRYHELPEPDTRIRGYTSTRITDEKPFKEQLAKYDDEAQKDVIDDDILSPVRQSVAEQNALRQAEEEEKSKMKIDELALVAEEELRKASGYMIPLVKVLSC